LTYTHNNIERSPSQEHLRNKVRKSECVPHTYTYVGNTANPFVYNPIRGTMYLPPDVDLSDVDWSKS